MAHAVVTTGHQNTNSNFIWRTGFIAAAISAVLNAAIFLIGRAADLVPSSVEVQSPTGEGALTIVPVLLMSIVPVVVAVPVYLLIRHVESNPARVFRVVGGVLLVLSLLLPFGIPDVPLKMALTLDLMHFVTGLAILVLIPGSDEQGA